MAWRIVLAAPAQKDLEKVPVADHRRVMNRLAALAADPTTADIKKLEGKEAGWRLRVGDWRVRFEFRDEERAIVVLRVLPRRDAYRG